MRILDSEVHPKDAYLWFHIIDVNENNHLLKGNNYGIFKLCMNEVVKYDNIDLYEYGSGVGGAFDCVFVHYLLKELIISKIYRMHFICNYMFGENSRFICALLPTKYNLIDYNWNDRVDLMVRERCELDHALSWLSTLGGAFSALGDYFPNCAEIAGKISINQLKLALRLGDPNVAARCRLYLSLSLIQKKKYKYARKIIYKEYQLAKNATVVDSRLLNMCQGIWSKLQYEHNLFRK